jgi:Zn-dependent protease with chaperone function
MFEGKINPSRGSSVYTFGLGLVAVFMAILPLIYISLILFVAYSTYWYTTHTWKFLTLGGMYGRAALMKVVLFITPIFTGTVLVFFMIKPLFAGRIPRAQPYAVNPGAEPLLFEFIQKIAALVGAPEPKRIDLNCELNAAAGFRRGWRSLLSNDLVLTIGLPLVAGLNMQQFAGVIAHEFGHFTQGFGMRLTYIIRTINGWFFRVVYERDQWDASLDDWAEAEDGWTALMVGVARLAVFCTRGVLKLLMMLGHFVSCFMLRQMEYDADHYEIELAGSETFEETILRFQALGAVTGSIYKEMRVTWNLNRRLPDNIPAFLVNKEQEQLQTIIDRLKVTLPNSVTKGFDTHPSDADRVRCARRANRPGIFHLRAPATELFSNFGVPARIVTLLHYKDDLQLPVISSNLFPTMETYSSAPSEPEEVIEPRESLLAKYYFGVVTPLRPLELPLVEIENIEGAVQELLGYEGQLRTVQEEISSACKELDSIDEAMLKARQGVALLKSGREIEPSAFALGSSDVTEGQQRIQNFEDAKDAALHRLRAVSEALGRRVGLALGLLRLPEMTHVLADSGTELDVIKENIDFMRVVAGHWKDVLQLRRASILLRALLTNCAYGNEMNLAMASANEKLSALETAFTTVSVPQPNKDAGLPLHQYCLGTREEDGNVRAVAAAAEGYLNRIFELCTASTEFLTRIADQLEQSLQSVYCQDKTDNLEQVGAVAR